jgi:hypothetical protein
MGLTPDTILYLHYCNFHYCNQSYIYFNMACHKYWDINQFKEMSSTDLDIFFNVCKFKPGHRMRFKWRLPVLRVHVWQTTAHNASLVPMHVWNPCMFNKHYFPT